MFDGKDRIKTTPATVFTQLEPTKVHTNTPVNKYIHVYSFALEPEKIEQPNGVCNFSELQEPQLHLSFNRLNVDFLLGKILPKSLTSCLIVGATLSRTIF